MCNHAQCQDLRTFRQRQDTDGGKGPLETFLMIDLATYIC